MVRCGIYDYNDGSAKVKIGGGIGGDSLSCAASTKKLSMAELLAGSAPLAFTILLPSIAPPPAPPGVWLPAPRQPELAALPLPTLLLIALPPPALMAPLLQAGALTSALTLAPLALLADVGPLLVRLLFAWLPMTPPPPLATQLVPLLLELLLVPPALALPLVPLAPMGTGARLWWLGEELLSAASTKSPLVTSTTWSLTAPPNAGSLPAAAGSLLADVALFGFVVMVATPVARGAGAPAAAAAAAAAATAAAWAELLAAKLPAKAAAFLSLFSLFSLIMFGGGGAAATRWDGGGGGGGGCSRGFLSPTAGDPACESFCPAQHKRNTVVSRLLCQHNLSQP